MGSSLVHFCVRFGSSLGSDGTGSGGGFAQIKKPSNVHLQVQAAQVEQELPRSDSWSRDSPTPAPTALEPKLVLGHGRACGFDFKPT